MLRLAVDWRGRAGTNRASGSLTGGAYFAPGGPMTTCVISRRSALRGLLLGTLSGTGLVLLGQETSGVRDLIAKTQEDLRRASEFMRSKNKERTRYEKAQRERSEFDR